MELMKLSSLKMPMKGMINWGLGQQLDALWLYGGSKDVLHYSRYQSQDLVEVWTKPLPSGQTWNCRKFVKGSLVYLQSISNEVCAYDLDKLELRERLPSLGNMYCLTDDGNAVVGNHASPSAAVTGIRLFVSPLKDLLNPTVQLDVPLGQTYSIGDFIWATRSQHGNIAITCFGKTYVDLYDKTGK
jgi:hypothetical protein